MKLAFLHDHRFRRASNGQFLSPGGLPYAVLGRYLHDFEEVVAVGREQAVGLEDSSRMTAAEGRGVRVEGISSSLGPIAVSGAVRGRIRAILAGVDCAIVRLPSVIGLIGIRQAEALGKPWAAEVVACAWDAMWNHGSIVGRMLAPAMFVASRRAIRRSKLTLYVSREFLQRRYPTKGVAVSCSDVSIEKPRAEVLERRLARIRGERPTGIRLGLVGSLDIAYKGHDTALNALAILRQSGIAATLSLLGAGNTERWRPLVARLGLTEWVEFVGTKPSGNPVYEWMDGLDVLVAPSRQEGLPRAAVEAMSRGLPVIGARTGGIPELVDPRLVHPPRDHRMLAALIVRLATFPDEYMFHASRNFRAADAYSIDKLDSVRFEFLGKLAESARKASAFHGL